MTALYGPWDYEEVSEQFPYDLTPTYELAAAFVNADGGLVEDWGCGSAWLRRFITSKYRGIDGAWSRWASEIADLRTYRSNAPCAVMRHVLEHNDDWRQVLANFMASWTHRAVLITFIPIATEDTHLEGPDWPVPDIALSGPDLIRLLTPQGVTMRHRSLETESQYDHEDIFYLRRQG